jgi:hypothetical protein
MLRTFAILLAALDDDVVHCRLTQASAAAS